MKAMLLRRTGPAVEDWQPLEAAERPVPEPGADELLLRVTVCGVCHTELDEIEGRAMPPRLPIVPGHQAVGRVQRVGRDVAAFGESDRVGVAWIYSACGRCGPCAAGDENLCPDFRATGRDADGGYAEFMTVPAAFAHPIPAGLQDAQAAPLLCAGAIGYRSLRLTQLGSEGRLGLTGFGASGHLVLKLVRQRWPAVRVHVFSRNPAERAFALQLGAAWAGEISDSPPEPLDAILDTTPAWKPVVEALRNLRPGGRLVINAIRKEEADQGELLRLRYPEHLWMEKEIKSVANVTRRDVREFLQLAAEADLRPEIREYPLAEANRALRELKRGGQPGAKVLRIAHDPLGGD
jgi:alcohol dehydrogenase, propanol-preferring